MHDPFWDLIKVNRELEKNLRPKKVCQCNHYGFHKGFDSLTQDLLIPKIQASGF